MVETLSRCDGQTQYCQTRIDQQHVESSRGNVGEIALDGISGKTVPKLSKKHDMT